MAAIIDDLLVEILSRVPAKSLCRFKCVSTHWLALIDHPDQRKKLPQSMSGFFYTSTQDNRPALRSFDILRHSTSPPFAFLPNHQRLDLLDGCNGLLLLCRWYSITEFRYVVCNPTTEQWVELPDRSQAGKVATVRLGFDAVVSSEFHVFVLLLDDFGFVTGLDVYSSETRRWVQKDRRWERMWFGARHSPTVFLNGHLHFWTFSLRAVPCVTAVDTKGETWTNFDLPGNLCREVIQLSQGRLHYALFAKHTHESDADIRLEVHVMDKYDTNEWTMKHSIKVSDIFEGIHVDTIRYNDICWIAIHPDCNLIFFTVGTNKSLVSYNIDRRQAKLITDLGRVSLAYVPYVPMYTELQSLNM